MEGGKPVVSDFMRELITKQADMIGEDGKAIVEDIESAAVCPITKLLPADVFKMIESCVASLEQKVRTRMHGCNNSGKGAGEAQAARGHKGAGDNAPREPAQQGQGH